MATPKSSQVAPCGGGKAKGKDKGKVKDETPPEEGEKKGHLLIRDLWTQGTESIHDMCVVNTHAVYHYYNTPEKCLQTADRKKNNKDLNALMLVLNIVDALLPLLTWCISF